MSDILHNKALRNIAKSINQRTKKRNSKRIKRGGNLLQLLEFAKQTTNKQIEPLSNLTTKDRQMAKLATESYNDYPNEIVNGYELILNSKKIKVWEKDKTLYLVYQGSKTEKDWENNVRLTFDDLESTDEFKIFNTVYQNLKTTFPNKKIIFVGHSLGGAMILHMKLLYPSITGFVFNPGVNLKLIRNGSKLNGINIYSLEKDIVSDPLGRFLPTSRFFKNTMTSTGDFIQDGKNAHNIDKWKVY